MTRLLRTGVVCYVLLLLAVVSHVYAADLPGSEHLSDAVFIRNNKTYTAQTAALFLRGKWEATLEDIMTAQDFIVKVASASSTSGQPYRIRFHDGREVPSGAYLGAALKKLEQQ